MVNVFKMLTASAMIEPGQSEELAIRFTPKKVGKFEADLIIRSNDPDLPEQKVLLRGEAVDPDDPELVGKDAGKEAGESEDGPGSTYDGGEDGGCGCRSVGSSHAAGHWVGLLGLAALGLARRRNRTVSTSKRV
jgi:MYXO-CTERM domain-containing protein